MSEDRRPSDGHDDWTPMRRARSGARPPWRLDALRRGAGASAARPHERRRSARERGDASNAGGSKTRARAAGSASDNHHPHRLRRALILGGALVLFSSITALAFGGKRIAAEESAFIGPATRSCVPPTLDASDVLPGTHLEVSPMPDSLDASRNTQISMLGVPSSQIYDVSVSGNYTGGHSGRLLAYSQGDGASFVPSHSFEPGETVSVHGRLHVGKGSEPFAFHFTVAIPDPLPYAHPGKQPTGKPEEVQRFHSEPNLEPPAVAVTTKNASESPGDIFVAPYSGPGQDGPMIFNSSGQLVWMDPLPFGTEATNLQVQQYEGKPVLTWWQGYIPPQGFGQGEEMVANSAYHTITRIQGGNGYKADLHDFHINAANDTALLTVFNPIHCDLAHIGGPQDGAVTDSIFQEIDLRTRLVRREWTALDHVPLTDSYSSPVGSSTEWPYDYFHINSVDLQPEGNLLLSARNTWALYELNGQTGQVQARAGGKHSTIKMGSGTLTAYQHDATALPGGLVSIFDNGGVPTVHPQSRGIVVSLNPQAGTETLVAEYEHPQALKAGSQGNVQSLGNGNLFLGWGAEPWVSEFNSGGQLLFDAHLPSKDESYRAYRFEWNGTPGGSPSIAASAGHSGPVTVYASWNGATEIASWRVLAGPSTHRLAPVATAARSGFETAITTPAAEAYVQVQALTSSGAVLGTSSAIKS